MEKSAFRSQNQSIADENSVVPFMENAVYTTDQVARIIHRHPNTVRDLCRRGSIIARMDRGGYLVTGWQLRAYLECRCVTAEG